MRSREQENQTNFEKGKKLFENSQYKQAARMFSGLIKNSSENPEYLYWYASTQYALKNYRNAVTYYQLAIDNMSNPMFADMRKYKSEACFSAAFACKKIQQYEQGLEYLKNARESYANSQYDILELDVLEGDLLQYTAPLVALKKYDHVLEQKPKDQTLIEKKVSICVIIGESYIKQQDYVNAAKYYEEAASIAMEKGFDKDRVEFLYLRTATCYLEQVKRDPENNIARNCAKAIFNYLESQVKLNIMPNDFAGKARSAYYAYMQDRNLNEAHYTFESLIKETPSKYAAMVYYYFAEIYANTVYSEPTIMLYCQSIQKDPGFPGAYEGLYNCLINVKKLDRNNFSVKSLDLISSILTFPNQEKKIQLLKILLDEKHPLGQFVLDKNNSTLLDKDLVYSIIQAIPYEQGRMDYLIRACKNQEDLLYKKVHEERNKPGFLGGVAQKLADELQSCQKYEHFFDPFKGLSVSAHKLLEKMLEMVPLKWMSENYAFEPVMMSHIIRKFNEFAKDTSDLALHKQYGTFIARCSAEDLFKAIFSDKRPEDKVSPDINKILLDCLNKDTILGKKFLVMKPDKDIVRGLILALPENNLEQLQAKKEILEKVLNKDETFKSIFWTPRHFGATVSVEEGTLKQLHQALQDINAKLAPVLPAKLFSRAKADSSDSFEMIGSDIIDDFEIVPSNSSNLS